MRDRTHRLVIGAHEFTIVGDPMCSLCASYVPYVVNLRQPNPSLFYGKGLTARLTLTMPKLFLPFLLIFVSITAIGQADSTISPGNSCKPIIDRRKTPLHYSYDVKTQTHDYSGNWDFDGDGETDGLYFIGTGGAHLYFYLKITLSSDKKVRDFTFLNLDFPCAGEVNELETAKFYPPPAFPQFVAGNFPSGKLGDNANDKIYIHLNNYSDIPKKWKKRGVNSRHLFIEYKNGDMTIRNFIE